jgi:hypothetical protein
MKYLLTLFTTLFISVTALSQNILTTQVEWKSCLTMVSETSSVAGENTKIVTSPSRVLWYNEDGTVRNDLSIEEAVGSWNDVSHDGSIMFHVNSGGSAGTVYFSRVGDAIQVSVHIIESIDSPSYDLTITSVNVL